MPNAFFQGVLGASSLLLGAMVGVFWQPGRTLSAAVMAFGSGTLLSAIAFEITLPVYQRTHQSFWPLIVGFILGGGLFTVITQYIDEQGGFVRHSASKRRYLYEHRQEEVSEVLDRIAHVKLVQDLPPSEVQAILPLLQLLIVEPGTVICQEGDEGDCMFLIVEGDAEIRKGSQVMATLGRGEVFGEMAVLTAEPRSATVVAQTPMELYKLNRSNYDSVVARSPHLAGALSRTLAQRLRETTRSRAEAEHHLEEWRKQVLDSVELDIPAYQEMAILQDLTSSAAPLAILVGTLIDNIPESAVIGIMSSETVTRSSFLLAVFISNFPEALSSSIGMRQAGTQPHRIIFLWIGVVLLSGLCAYGGSLLGHSMPVFVVAIAQAFSGGAILAMLASTMMPEAYELGGSIVVFATISGFLAGFLISSSQT
jgi:CRP-like cAMP-binding protein